MEGGLCAVIIISWHLMQSYFLSSSSHCLWCVKKEPQYFFIAYHLREEEEEEKPDDKVKVYAEIHDIITTLFSSPLLLEAEDDFFPSRVCVCDCVWGYSTSSDTKMSIIDFGIDDSCHGMS